MSAQQEPLQSQAPATTEVTPEVKTETESPLSPKFAALARKERALRAEAQKLKAREEAMKAQEADYSSKYIPKDRLTKDPLGVLTEQGLTMDQITNMLLNQPGPQDQAVSRLEAKIQELEAKLQKQVTTQEETQTQNYDRAVNQIRNEAKLLVDSDPAFETIKDTDNVEAIVELIKETYASDNIVLSVQDAAKQIEDYLIEEAMKMASLKKVKEKLTPQEVVEAQQSPAQTPQSQLKTLTNAVSATSKPMSNKDRRERAILAFKGQLK